MLNIWRSTGSPRVRTSIPPESGLPPGLLNRFTTAQINAPIAPRAHLGLVGLQDKLTPVQGLDIIDRELTKVYAAAGHPER